ncbi:uncharacterized protein LOC120336927 [Styela clava]|uniref:uncharacterized protein LOC120336927 n=1 Tax=Styela clava TaxID=7725 RepID=UPI001939C3C0|nr:uncharacterized protein LOC120336927 [Styela clava]
MGAYSSAFVPEESSLVSSAIKPSGPEWIVAHVNTCGVPVLKVQRCWHRFLQMGADRNGTLTPKAKIHSSANRFVKQIIQLLPRNERGVVTFQVFLNACVWFEAAQAETKIKVIFYLMNRGQPVDANLFNRVIGHLYPGVSQTQLRELAESTVKQIDRKNQDKFDEEDFLKWVMEKPDDEMNNLLAFDILPPTLTS